MPLDSSIHCSVWTHGLFNRVAILYQSPAGDSRLRSELTETLSSVLIVALVSASIGMTMMTTCLVVSGLELCSSPGYLGYMHH
jgi:hypothetical protein